MPIYEYTCGRCTRDFEHLARSSRETAPACPHCGASDSRKQLSTFAPAVAATAAGAACGDCRASPMCPSAGKGCATACGA